MTDWTKNLDGGDTDVTVESDPPLRAVDDSAATTTTTDDWTQAPAGADTPSVTADSPRKTSGQSRRGRLILTGIIAGVVVLILALVIWLAGSFSGSEEDFDGDQAQAVTSSPVETPTIEDSSSPDIDLAKTVTQAGDCDSSDAAVPDDQDSPQQAVAAFQTAYFNGSVRDVKAVIAKDSPLQKQNWDTVLGDLAKSSFCLTMQPTSTDTVDTELVQKTADKKTRFRQQVTTVKTGDGYKISKIKAKK